MSQFDAEIEQIEHELTVLGRQSVEKGKRLVELRAARGRALNEELRILGAFKEDPGTSFALQSIMGEEDKFRCKLCNRLLVGKELHGNTCNLCRVDSE